MKCFQVGYHWGILEATQRSPQPPQARGEMVRRDLLKSRAPVFRDPPGSAGKDS